MKRGQRTRRHDEAAILQACGGRDGPLHLGPVAYIDRGYFQAERRCDSLNPIYPKRLEPDVPGRHAQ
jgi:hypothetical protein